VAPALPTAKKNVVGSTASHPGEDDDFLLFDGECPVCATYIAASRLGDAADGPPPLDARHEPALVEAMRRQGLEVNDGMIARLDGRIYYGPEVTRLIAERATEAPAATRGLLYAIGGAPWSRALYPLLVKARLWLLRLRGRTLIP
jgi:predicted DCC family thiol-disulfide oxidoreductase YuxK